MEEERKARRALLGSTVRAALRSQLAEEAAVRRLAVPPPVVVVPMLVPVVPWYGSYEGQVATYWLEQDVFGIRRQ